MQVVMAVRAAGGDAVAVLADVSDSAATAEMFNTIEHALGPIRALVCNAGVDREAALVSALGPAAPLRGTSTMWEKQARIRHA